MIINESEGITTQTTSQKPLELSIELSIELSSSSLRDIMEMKGDNTRYMNIDIHGT